MYKLTRTEYKLTRTGGFDFYSGTINYRDAIGSTVRETDYDSPAAGACGKGLHASRNPNNCFVGASIPCAAFRVKGIGRIAGDSQKTRYKALKVVEEIYDLNVLFGWNYVEAVNPVHPFKISPPVITDEHIASLKDWARVRASVGASLRASVGASLRANVRASLRANVWASVRDSVGASVRASVWASVWDNVGASVWDSVWDNVGASVWDSVWDSVWAYTGSLFPQIKKWEYAENMNIDGYPYQSAVDLWRQGLVPTFNSKVWQLRGGSDGKVLWER